ncbi:MAG: type II toxin-antitoxin system RelE/ParE family toxin [Bacteroidota bacterium]
MSRRILITAKASQDLDRAFAYIAQNNNDAALRFFDAARKTIAQLL